MIMQPDTGEQYYEETTNGDVERNLDRPVYLSRCKHDGKHCQEMSVS